MGKNELFQQARHFVEKAVHSSKARQEQAVEIAQNALSSAYANSTIPQQKQLRHLQKELDQLK